ncbi:MAG: hypothetical protein GQ544_09730 [Candidatus Aminicenantes bacterium]|nr:hypothetical protein [Candidatus Aminicenantes bacterium]
MMLKRVVLVLMILALSTGSIRGWALKDDIKINLTEKRYEQLGPAGLQLVYYISLANSSSKTYRLSGYNYRFVVNEIEYFRLPGELGGGLRIDPNKSTLIKLPVQITYERLFQTIAGAKDMTLVPCYIMGEMKFSERRRARGSLPFAFSAQFPIFEQPILEIAPLLANSLTIGGADLNFQLKVNNPNSVELEVDELGYELKFGGHAIQKKKVYRIGTVPSQGDELFSIALLFNFYEVGQDIQGLLNQETMNCRFTGQIVFNSEWGRIPLSFDVEHRVPIVRNE